MTSKVNADNTLGGVILSGDSSGILDLQAGGVTKVTVGPSGVTLADVLPVTSGGTGASSLSGITVGTATSAGTATNVAGGVAGNVPYQTGAGATSFVTNGTSGQVLTSAGAAAPTWETLTVSGSGGATASGNVTLTSASEGAQSITPAGYGAYVKLPDATTMSKAAVNFSLYNAGEFPMKILDSGSNNLGFIYPKQTATVGCADISTVNGIWVIDGAEPVADTLHYANTTLKWGQYALGTCFALDNDRQFITFTDVTANSVYAVVYDSNTGTSGAATLVDTSSTVYGAAAILVSTDTVLIGYVKTTTTNGRVLTISGTTITVNSAGTNASGAAPTAPARFTLIGSTYVMDQGGHVIAFTVSGTTVTAGAAVALTGNYGAAASNSYIPMYATLWQVTSSTFARFSQTNNTGVYAQAFSISGVTITAGSLLTLSVGTTTQNDFYAFVCESQWALCYSGASNRPTVSIISISGTTCSASTVTTAGTTALNSTVSTSLKAMVVGSKAIVASVLTTGVVSINIVTNTAGTASAGTAYTPTIGNNNSPNLCGASGNYVSFLFTDAADTNRLNGLCTMDCSGSSPTLFRKKYVYLLASSQSSTATVLTNIDSFGRNYNLLGSRTGSLYSTLSTNYYGSPITRSTGTGIQKVNTSYFVDFFDNTTGVSCGPGVTAYENWNFLGAATAGATSTGVAISKMECSIL